MSLFWKNRLVKTLPWGPGGMRSPQGSCPVVTLSWGTGGRGTLRPPHNSRLTSTSNLHHWDPTGFPQGRHPTRTGSLQAASRHQTAYLCTCRRSMRWISSERARHGQIGLKFTAVRKCSRILLYIVVLDALQDCNGTKILRTGTPTQLYYAAVECKHEG